MERFWNTSKFWKEITALCLFCLVFYYIDVLVFYGRDFFEKQDLFYPLLIKSFYTTALCYSVYSVSCRRRKSVALFALLSWGLVILGFTTLMMGGYARLGTELYRVIDNGHITLVGVFYRLSSPVTVMAFYATYLFIKKMSDPSSLTIKKVFTILFALCVVIVACVVGSKMNFASKKDSADSFVQRYRVTVYIETPEGVKVGSTVRELSARVTCPDFGVLNVDEYDGSDLCPPDVIVKGEAVTVDLGKRGTILALMNTGYGEWATLTGVQDNSNNGILHPGGYPVFIHFADSSNPRTVESIYKYDSNADALKDRFEELLGEGVKLKKITIEKTDEPVAR